MSFRRRLGKFATKFWEHFLGKKKQYKLPVEFVQVSYKDLRNYKHFLCCRRNVISKMQKTHIYLKTAGWKDCIPVATRATCKIANSENLSSSGSKASNISLTSLANCTGQVRRNA